MPTPADAAVQLTISVRAPIGAEWAACRALLPEAFAGAVPAGALLAIDKSTGAALGCAAFQRTERFIVHLRVRVLRNSRRQGIGTALLEAVTRVGAEEGAREIHARADAMAMPDGEPFLIANGFALRRRLWTVEASKEPLYSHLQRLLAAGARKHGDDNAVMARLTDVAREPLARLYTGLVVPELNLPPGAAAPLIEDPRFAESPVLTVSGEPVGMLLLEANDGAGVCTIVARAVKKEYQQRAWANLRLLAEGFERGGRKGSTRMRFEAPGDNPDTMKLVSRAQAKVTRSIGWFVRAIDWPFRRSA